MGVGLPDSRGNKWKNSAKTGKCPVFMGFAEDFLICPSMVGTWARSGSGSPNSLSCSTFFISETNNNDIFMRESRYCPNSQFSIMIFNRVTNSFNDSPSIYRAVRKRRSYLKLSVG